MKILRIFAVLTAVACMSSPPAFADHGRGPAGGSGESPREARRTDKHERPPESASRIFPYDIHVAKLDNGMTVVTVPMETPGLMAYFTLVRVGSRNEVEKGRTGFAHFFEHMMFRGTKTYSQDARNEFLKTIGADDNGFTTDDFTAYTVFGGNDRMEKLIEIEADRIQNLHYEEPEFKTEARAVLGEYSKSISNPLLKMEEKLLGAAFTRHTYRHTTIGFVEDIEAMPEAYDYSWTFFKRFYTPDNVILFVTGDIEPDRIEPLVKKHYGAWKGKAAFPKIPVEPEQKKERRVEIAWESETNPRMMVGYHTPAEDLRKLEHPTQIVLGDLLLGPASELHRDLVLERGIVESLSNWSYAHRDPHLFTFVVTLKDEKDREEVWKTIREKIDAIGNGEVDEKLLADVVSNTRYSTLLGLETPDAVASTLVFSSGPTGDPLALEKTLAGIRMVKPADVTRFAKTYLMPTNRTVVTLTSRTTAPEGSPE